MKEFDLGYEPKDMMPSYNEGMKGKTSYPKVCIMKLPDGMEVPELGQEVELYGTVCRISQSEDDSSFDVEIKKICNDDGESEDAENEAEMGEEMAPNIEVKVAKIPTDSKSETMAAFADFMKMRDKKK